MQLFLLSLTAAALTVILHTIGTENHWYWTHRWFDIITHLLGGLSLGLLATALFTKTEKYALLTIAAVLPLVVGWEVFEVVFVGINPGSVAYNIETARDILISMLGACGAILIHAKG